MTHDIFTFKFTNIDRVISVDVRQKCEVSVLSNCHFPWKRPSEGQYCTKALFQGNCRFWDCGLFSDSFFCFRFGRFSSLVCDCVKFELLRQQPYFKNEFFSRVALLYESPGGNQVDGLPLLLHCNSPELCCSKSNIETVGFPRRRVSANIWGRRRCFSKNASCFVNGQ